MPFKLLIQALVLWAVLPLHAQNPTGIWKTIDEKTGKAKSHIEICEDNGQFYGKIVEILEDDYIDTCTRCSGEK